MAVSRVRRLACHFAIFAAVYGAVMVSSHLLTDAKAGSGAVEVKQLVDDPCTCPTVARCHLSALKSGLLLPHCRGCCQYCRCELLALSGQWAYRLVGSTYLQVGQGFSTLFVGEPCCVLHTRPLAPLTRTNCMCHNLRTHRSLGSYISSKVLIRVSFLLCFLIISGLCGAAFLPSSIPYAPSTSCSMCLSIPVTCGSLFMLYPFCSDLRAWFSSYATLSDMPQEERLRLLREENEWKNTFVMWMFPDSVREQIPHMVQTWLRCWILCAAVYFGVGGLWCYYTYFCFGDKLFEPGTIPGAKAMWEQIVVRPVAEWTHGIMRTDNGG
jgi:hypothetical protein